MIKLIDVDEMDKRNREREKAIAALQAAVDELPGTIQLLQHAVADMKKVKEAFDAIDTEGRDLLGDMQRQTLDQMYNFHSRIEDIIYQKINARTYALGLEVLTTGLRPVPEGETQDD